MPKNNTRTIKAKRNTKNSVFLDLFKNKKYLLELYRTLHPEDTEATEDVLTDVTIENVLTDNIYNDLGFMVRDRLIILIEAQSTWTVNILIRIFLYLAESYHRYFQKTRQNLYNSKKVKMPRPELYVIYTGDRGSKPDVISLSNEFFAGADVDIEIKAKVIYEREGDDIINQYIIFCKVFNEQVKLHGLTKQAVAETIRICKDRNVLKEYLENREMEVATIKSKFFDQEEVMRIYVKCERHDAAQKADRATARRMIRQGKLSLEEIAEYIPSLSVEELKKMEARIMRMA